MGTQSLYNRSVQRSVKEKTDNGYEFGNLNRQNSSVAENAGNSYENSNFKGIGEQQNNHFELGDLGYQGAVQPGYSSESAQSDKRGNQAKNKFDDKDKYQI